MNKDEIVKDIVKTICEFENPCNECEFNTKEYRCSYKAYAEQVYNAGYRKVADDDDEIVESMKTYEKSREETAREILQRFYNRAKSNKNDFADVNSYEIELMAEEFGIELE